jgi:hypothetical protein
MNQNHGKFKSYELMERDIGGDEMREAKKEKKENKKMGKFSSSSFVVPTCLRNEFLSFSRNLSILRDLSRCSSSSGVNLSLNK